MSARRFGLVFALFMAAIGSSLSGTQESQVIVDLHAHRAEIRAVLLQYTPLGSSVKDVVEFVSKQLQRTGETSPVTVQPASDGSRPRATKTIRVYLGQYYDHPEVFFLLFAPLMMQKEVTAYWWFDQHDRLIDIVVDKKSGVY